jgi:hypothetical protein
MTQPRNPTPRRFWRASVLALAVGAVVASCLGAVTALGTSRSAPTAASASRAQRIRLVEIQRGNTQLDLGKRGFSPGDRQTITSDLERPKGGAAGRLDDDCAITAVGKRAGAVCNFVISLPGGQLTGEFFQSFGPGGEPGKLQAITGGTGRYARARGEIRVGTEGARTPFVVNLH